MSKIATYSLADSPLQLSDRLIGTEAPRTPPSITPLATKNFSLGELLTLFSSNFPAASLQAVLDTNNTAIQDINLTGTIYTTLIKPTNIEDMLGSQGTVFQFLSKAVGGFNWVDLPIGTGVQTVTGPFVDNTDPLNPIVNNPPSILTNTITDGDTTHAPDGNSVFDAFANLSTLYYPLSSNPAGYLTQQSVLEFPSFSSFPLIGASDTIYIAVDTDLAYYWDGVSYVAVINSTSGITGFGTINTLPKFTPTGSQLRDSRFTDNGVTGRYGSSSQYVSFLPTSSNTFLSLVRSQSNMSFILGNAQLPFLQENIIASDNTVGTSFTTKGYLSLKVGATAATEGLRILSTGQLTIGQTPATGLTSDFLLLRDTSGNVKQIAYPTIPTAGLTSVGLTMPLAFSVANSPLIADGTIAVTATGTSSQYIRGDGQLATLPSGGGGGSSVFYYLNGSVAASVALYKQMSNSAIIGTGTDFPLAGNGLIAQFLTDVGNPNRLTIPGGAWNFEMFFSMSSSGGTPKFYVELLKYDGVTFTTIANNLAVPEAITGGTNIDLYLTSLAVPETALLLTDRLAIRVYIVNSVGGRTATLHTQDSHLCQIVTTFAGGISAINGLGTNNQYLAVGTTGSDFNINSLSETHTFNLPSASATNRGALTSADWTAFDSKQNALGYTPENVANKENTTLDNSATKYPTNNLVFNAIENLGLTTAIANPYSLRATTLGSAAFTQNGQPGAGIVTFGPASATVGSTIFKRQLRINFSTLATAGSIAYFRTTFGLMSVGCNYECEWLFGTADAATVTGARSFIGLSNSFATPANVEPTSLVNIIGIARLSTSSNWHIVHNDAAGLATSIDLGSSFPSNTLEVDLIYLKLILNIDNTVSYSVINVTTDIVATGLISTNLPATVLYETIWTTNNATALIASLGFCIRTFTNKKI